MENETITVQCSWCEKEQPCRLTSPIKPGDKWEEVQCPVCNEIIMIVQRNGKWVNYDEMLEKQKIVKLTFGDIGE